MALPVLALQAVPLALVALLVGLPVVVREVGVPLDVVVLDEEADAVVEVDGAGAGVGGLELHAPSAARAAAATNPMHTRPTPPCPIAPP